MGYDEHPGFLALSARLTGRGEDELRATGLVARHHATTLARAGRAAVGRFVDDLAAAGGDPGRLAAPESRELARAVTHLWRTGRWPGEG
ncbi:hypothetical protein [Streptomyces caatingaensis]|uniref:hypothetical protein n=1 Tax=Streptomyces caatingaensis TaxID=1678637 RepID=UPI0006727B2C|nr:hypothetical protein [Streptomyces caatingaensis]